MIPEIRDRWQNRMTQIFYLATESRKAQQCHEALKQSAQ
jgi:hypothetical protein